MGEYHTERRLGMPNPERGSRLKKRKLSPLIYTSIKFRGYFSSPALGEGKIDPSAFLRTSLPSTASSPLPPPTSPLHASPLQVILHARTLGQFSQVTLSPQHGQPHLLPDTCALQHNIAISAPPANDRR